MYSLKYKILKKDKSKVISDDLSLYFLGKETSWVERKSSEFVTIKDLDLCIPSTNNKLSHLQQGKINNIKIPKLYTESFKYFWLIACAYVCNCKNAFRVLWNSQSCCNKVFLGWLSNALS